MLSSFYKVVMCVLISLFLCSSQVYSDNSQQSKDHHCRLVYGWDQVKPYQYYNQNKQVVGFQIDLVRSITRQMGCDLELQQAIWEDLIMALKKGKVDFIADITITEERAKYGYFSDSYRKETYTLYVSSSELEKFQGKSLPVLIKSGFKLGLTKGYLYSEELEAYRQNLQFKQQFSEQDENITNYQLLIKGEIDGFIEDSLVAGYTLRNNSISHLIKALPLEVHRGDVSFWLSKKRLNPKMLERFNQALRQVKQSSEYQKNWLRDIK